MSRKLILQQTNLNALASVITYSVSATTKFTTVGNGNVSDNGGDASVVRGFCFSELNNDPTVYDSYVLDLSTGSGLYNVVITDLTPETSYTYRAFAQNDRGVSYGNIISFSTTSASIGNSYVMCLYPTNVSTQTVTLTSYSEYDTSSGIDVSRGMCYSYIGTSTDPRPENLSSTFIKWDTVKNTTSTYVTNLTNLIPGATYYWNSFLYNNKDGYIMSTNGPFNFTTQTWYTTTTVPEVETLDVSSRSTNDAWLKGVVYTDGNSLTRKGIIWSRTNSSPFLLSGYYDSSVTDNATGVGYFNLNATSLLSSTRYYYRAFAWNSNGLVYGDTFSFSTLYLPSTPTVELNSISSISETTANITANVTSDGGSTTYKGICWMPYSSMYVFPTINDSSLQYVSTGTGSYVITATPLDCSTRYIVRAFAYNTGGISYSGTASFYTVPCSSPPTLPSVTTVSATNILTTSATLRGNVTSNGSGSFAYRGICVSTGSTPVAFDFPPGYNTPYGFVWSIPQSDPTKFILDPSVGTGSYSINFSGLIAGTTYYFRAFALNFYGMSYGSTLSFNASTYTTGAPTVQTIGGSYDAGTGIASLTGNVSNTGNATTVYRAICVSTGSTPVITDVSILYPTTSGTGAYTCARSLPANATYYYRAYAWNTSGGSYGSPLSLSTGSGSSYPSIRTFYSGSSKTNNERCTTIPISSLTYNSGDFLLIFFSTRSNGTRYWWNSEEGWSNNSKWNINRYGTNNTHIHTNIGYRLATKTSADNLRICCATQSLFPIAAEAVLNYHIYVISGHNVTDVNADFGTYWYHTVPTYKMAFGSMPPISANEGLFNVCQGRAKFISGYSYSYSSPRLPGWESYIYNPYWRYLSRISDDWMSITFLAHAEEFKPLGDGYTVTPPSGFSNVKYSPKLFESNNYRGQVSIASATRFSTDTSIARGEWAGRLYSNYKDDYVSWGFYIR